MSSLLSSLLFATLRQLRSVALLMGFTLFTLGWSVSVHAEPFAYIANAFSNTVSVLDTATNVIVATVPVGIAPRGVAVTPTGDFVYITNANSETVSVIATNTNTVVATIRVGATPWGVAVTPNGAFVYVANTDSDTVSVIDAVSNSVVATIAVGWAPAGVAVTPDGAFVYVMNYGDFTASVIATANNTIVATIPLEDNPTAVTVAPSGDFAYIVSGGGTLSVIKTKTHREVATIPIGVSADAVTVTPDSALVYVADSGSDTVSVIATKTRKVIATVAVGDAPNGVAVTPDGAFIYVTNALSHTTAVIATATNTVVATIPTERWAASLGQFIGPAVCGNGIIGGGEQCDDANTTKGDGCSSTCTVEPGYSCSGTSSVCQPANHAPVAQCHNVTVSTGLNTCAVASASINNGSSDPDSDPLTFTQTPAGPYALGTTTVSLTVSDGTLSSQCSGTVTVLDGQAPTISCPVDQTVTARVGGTPVPFSPMASDNCGTVITGCDPVSGSIFPLGTTPVTCTATDGAGITNNCDFAVNVRYGFSGFFSPVNNPPAFNGVKAGKAVQVKFSLGGNFGLGVLAAGSPTSQVIDCNSGTPVNNSEEPTTSDSGFSYDAVSDRYQYGWKTEIGWSHTCRQLNVTLIDGTMHSARFSFR